MTKDEVLAELRNFGGNTARSEQDYDSPHGNRFSVKIADMKKVVKRVKKDHNLALALFDTGNVDAMYFAGLIADEKVVTREELQHWADSSNWSMITEYPVAWLASESQFALEMGLKWIDSREEKISSCGWATLSHYVSLTPDRDLDLSQIKKLMDRAASELHQSPNRTKYCMNGFILSCACSISELTSHAVKLSRKIGKVEVNMGATACKVPHIEEYIQKVDKRGKLGAKRTSARC